MGVLPMSVQTQTLHVGDNDFEVCDTSHVEGAEALPHSLRILLENVLRNVDDADARELYAKRIVDAGTPVKSCNKTRAGMYSISPP